MLIQENTYRRAHDSTTLDRLLRITYYSVVTYLMFALVALLLHIDRSYVETVYKSNEDDPAELVWRGALLILVPSVIVATATRAWDESKGQARWLKACGISSTHRKPTGWDFFFQQQRQAYVRVTFADGKQICGYYGADSFAAYAKDGPDLYLERVHNGVRGARRANTCGAWIKVQDAAFVEFYSPDDDAD